MNTITNATENGSDAKHPSKKRSLKTPLIVSAVVLVAAGATFSISSFLHAQKPAAAPSRTPVLTVTYAEAAMQPIERKMSVHGTISAWDPVTVGATAGGLEVKNIFVDDGSIVHKGQVLAVLDSSTLRAQLDSEQARLASSQANVGKSIQPNRPEDINALAAMVAQNEANVLDAESALVQAQANLENAVSNVKRYEELRSAGAVSAQETETRQLNTKVCEANVHSATEKVQAAKFLLKQAKERLSMARIGGRKEDIDIAHASVAEITGNVKRLQTQIDQTIIKAPVDGLIVKRDAHLGDISTAGKGMFYMARDNRLELKAQIPQDDLKVVKPGQIVMLDPTAGTDTNICGRVREISPMVDSDSRLATARIDLPSNSGLKPGLYAEGHIAIGRTTALSVPPQAVISRDEKSTVFVLHNDQVEARVIVTGARTNSTQEVVSGLAAGEKVVVSGAGFLKDGDYVAVSQ